ncbi:hypothetical protein MPL1032_180089 [Mesorhizobium plurifarium]|uniref:Uncharacterized protein n=1 Tax=Mesorhizobium plurifarium TaxID=69974 RepID=A0A0K2VTL1_MESPL|nr:hypothetical protein MPL1032_180089 [Mesorhizobium plurifarium]
MQNPAEGSELLLGRAFKICNAFAGKVVAFRLTENRRRRRRLLPTSQNPNHRPQRVPPLAKQTIRDVFAHLFAMSPVHTIPGLVSAAIM